MNDAAIDIEENEPAGAHLEAFQRAARDLMDGEGGLTRARRARDCPPGFDEAFLKSAAALGLLGVMTGEEHGGLGLGLSEVVAIAREWGRAAAPEPLATTVFATNLIGAAENDVLKADLLPKILSCEILPAVAMQESPFPGINEAQSTIMAASDNHLLLHGKKCCVTAAQTASGYIVNASDEGSEGLFWVAADSEGLTRVDSQLADGTFHSELVFDGVELAEDQRLAATGAASEARRYATAVATIAAAAELVGLAEGALDLTLNHLRTREQFGKPIGSFQALQHRAVNATARVELAIAVVEEATAAAHNTIQKLSFDALEVAASRAKARAIDTAMHVCREAVQMHGAMGFTDECDASLFVRRTLVMTAFLGGANFHRRRYATLCPPVDELVEKSPPVSESLKVISTAEEINALTDEDFRLFIRDIIENNYPDHLRYLPRRVRWDEVRDYNLFLAERGLIAPAWPRQWGGLELSPVKQLIYFEENERWGVGRAPDQGIRQLGPVLMRYGSDAQKAEYLPKILAFEHIWCQGYSEPNAGSDLASVATKGEVDGDDLVVNGQKIWTSLAQDATHIYLLCRTDPEATKHDGLTFVVMPMDTPGLTIREITNIAGDNEFCEVFFDDARVPLKNVIGGLNKGWEVTKALLGYERLGVAAPHRPMMALNKLTKLGMRLGLFADPEFVGEYTKHRLNLVDHATLYAKYAAAVGRGEPMGPEVGFLKIWGMEALQLTTEFAMERAEALGALAGPIEVDGEEIDLLSAFYMAKVATIGGGTNEIQRNIIARRYLDLPK